MTGAAIVASENFGVLDRLTVRGRLRGSTANNSGSVGAVAAKNAGTISRTRVTIQLEGGTSLGGVVAANQRDGLVEDVDVTVDAKGNVLEIGGIAAANEGVIRRARVRGKLLGSTAVGVYGGGVAGFNEGVIEDSSAEVELSIHERAGGLVGVLRNGVLRRSWSNSTVLTEVYSGGVVGSTAFSFVLEDCYGLGTLISQSPTSTPITRGFVDLTTKDLQGNASHVTQVYGTTGSDGSVAALSDPATFADLDPTVWAPDAATLATQGHPLLRWQVDEGVTAPGPAHVAVTLQASPFGAPKSAWMQNTSTGRTYYASFYGSVATLWVEPGPVKYSVRDRDDRNCRLYQVGDPWKDPIPATATITAPTYFNIQPECKASDAAFRGPFLRAARDHELSPGELIATAAGQELRFTEGTVVRDGVDVTPRGWDLSNHRPLVDGDYVYFFMSYPKIEAGAGRLRDHDRDWVALIGTPTLQLSTGQWRQPRDFFFNLAGLTNVRIENRRIKGEGKKFGVEMTLESTLDTYLEFAPVIE